MSQIRPRFIRFVMILKLKSNRHGNHVHTDMWMGEDRDHLASIGSIIQHIGEYQLFFAAIGLGIEHMFGNLELIESEDSDPLGIKPE